MIAKKSSNLLTKQAVVPQQSKDAIKFRLVRSLECARVRWAHRQPLSD